MNANKKIDKRQCPQIKIRNSCFVCFNACTHARDVDEWATEQLNEIHDSITRMNQWMNEWMNQWMNEWIILEGSTHHISQCPTRRDVAMTERFQQFPEPALHHITSHHITSHHITSHHITSHHITSYHITSHHFSVSSQSKSNHQCHSAIQHKRNKQTCELRSSSIYLLPLTRIHSIMLTSSMEPLRSIDKITVTMMSSPRTRCQTTKAFVQTLNR